MQERNSGDRHERGDETETLIWYYPGVPMRRPRKHACVPASCFLPDTICLTLERRALPCNQSRSPRPRQEATETRGWRMDSGQRQPARKPDMETSWAAAVRCEGLLGMCRSEARTSRKRNPSASAPSKGRVYLLLLFTIPSPVCISVWIKNRITHTHAQTHAHPDIETGQHRETNRGGDGVDVVSLAAPRLFCRSLC